MNGLQSQVDASLRRNDILRRKHLFHRLDRWGVDPTGDMALFIYDHFVPAEAEVTDDVFSAEAVYAFVVEFDSEVRRSATERWVRHG